MPLKLTSDLCPQVYQLLQMLAAGYGSSDHTLLVWPSIRHARVTMEAGQHPLGVVNSDVQDPKVVTLPQEVDLGLLAQELKHPDAEPSASHRVAFDLQLKRTRVPRFLAVHGFLRIPYPPYPNTPDLVDAPTYESEGRITPWALTVEACVRLVYLTHYAIARGHQVAPLAPDNVLFSFDPFADVLETLTQIDRLSLH